MSPKAPRAACCHRSAFLQVSAIDPHLAVRETFDSALSPCALHHDVEPSAFLARRVESASRHKPAPGFHRNGSMRIEGIQAIARGVER
jgi:hypothetical protein